MTRPKEETQIAVIQTNIEHIKKGMDIIGADVKEMKSMFVPMIQFNSEKEESKRAIDKLAAKEAVDETIKRVHTRIDETIKSIDEFKKGVYWTIGVFIIIVVGILAKAFFDLIITQ
jgi:hypothetical protein